MSREHLWPRWALRTFDGDALKETTPHSLHDGAASPYKAWSAPIFSATLKRVCESCNNGWMSALEGKAQRHATPMLLGESCVVDREAQHAISMWGYLKCLLFVAVGGDEMQEAMAPAYRTFFHLWAEDLLPLHTSIFVANHIGSRPGQYQHRLLGNDPDRPSLFIQTLTVRHLTLQVVKSYQVRAPVELERHPAVAGSDHRIWPTGPSFLWPSGPGLNDEALTLYTGPQPGECARPAGNRAGRRARRRAQFRRRSS